MQYISTHTHKRKKKQSRESFLTHLQTNGEMPGLCMSRAAVRIRIPARVRSPVKQYKKDSSFIKAETDSGISDDLRLKGYLPESESSNRVVVVVDSSSEAKTALEWALTHTVQSRDTVILLHVDRKEEKTDEYNDQRASNLLQATKYVCQLRRPEVHVEIAIREGKEKGETIVEAAKQLRASLLVLGQRKQSLLRHLQIWKRRRAQSRVVDYCIQNTDCMTIAVRRKNRKYGGYLITTKRHKNFWLLA